MVGSLWGMHLALTPCQRVVGLHAMDRVIIEGDDGELQSLMHDHDLFANLHEDCTMVHHWCIGAAVLMHGSAVDRCSRAQGTYLTCTVHGGELEVGRRAMDRTDICHSVYSCIAVRNSTGTSAGTKSTVSHYSLHTLSSTAVSPTQLSVGLSHESD